MKHLATPVAFMVFNRPETTRRVFAAIAAVRPAHLLLIADGPRPDRSGEAEQCLLVRQIVTAVDWPCTVETNFSEENMGCRRRVISGLNWVFSLVEQAIILEDDCLPDPSFFPFCTEMLERYREERGVGVICGYNALETIVPQTYSYLFSRMVGPWGWATWRRAWREYDEHLLSWPQLKADGVLRRILPDRRSIAYWTRILDAMHDGTGSNTWDYQWIYTAWAKDWMCIVPSRNLIQNIGFGPDATHTTGTDPGAYLSRPAHTMSFPLRHPPAITELRQHTIQMQRRIYAPGVFRKIQRRLLSKFGTRSR
jgi:hypothetical protein